MEGSTDRGGHWAISGASFMFQLTAREFAELEVTNCDFQFRRQKDLSRKIEARHFMDRLRNPEIRP